MGLDSNTLRMLLHAKAMGADFSKFAMIGRQAIHMSRENLAQVLGEFGVESSRTTLETLMPKSGRPYYAEPLLRHLGAEDIHSFDNSSYEQATHLHDMNLPVDPKFHKNYSFLLDGGSLEHVFSFPTALSNCMQMLQRGGCL